MKKIPTVIDKCSDCPCAHELGIGLRCSKIRSNSSPNFVEYNTPIPEWCPLEDVIEKVGNYYEPPCDMGKTISRALPENPFSEEDQRMMAKASLELIWTTLGNRDIITRYMRKQRLV